jgi:hypothetical protein
MAGTNLINYLQKFTAVSVPEPKTFLTDPNLNSDSRIPKSAPGIGNYITYGSGSYLVFIFKYQLKTRNFLKFLWVFFCKDSDPEQDSGTNPAGSGGTPVNRSTGTYRTFLQIIFKGI